MDHFKDGSRGFSIHEDAVLDMRFDTAQDLTAEKLISKESIDNLSTIFQQYADFRPEKADELAQTIAKERKQRAIKTTGDFRTILGLC